MFNYNKSDIFYLGVDLFICKWKKVKSCPSLCSTPAQLAEISSKLWLFSINRDCCRVTVVFN